MSNRRYWKILAVDNTNNPFSASTVSKAKFWWVYFTSASAGWGVRSGFTSPLHRKLPIAGHVCSVVTTVMCSIAFHFHRLPPFPVLPSPIYTRPEGWDICRWPPIEYRDCRWNYPWRVNIRMELQGGRCPFSQFPPAMQHSDIMEHTCRCCHPTAPVRNSQDGS